MIDEPNASRAVAVPDIAIGRLVVVQDQVIVDVKEVAGDRDRGIGDVAREPLNWLAVDVADRSPVPVLVDWLGGCDRTFADDRTVEVKAVVAFVFNVDLPEDRADLGRDLAQHTNYVGTGIKVTNIRDA